MLPLPDDLPGRAFATPQSPKGSLAYALRSKPPSAPLRRCCSQYAVTRRILPQIGRDNVFKNGIPGITEELYGGQGTIGEGSFYDQPLLIVDDHLETLDLVTLNSASPSQERSVIIQPIFGGVPAVPARAYGR